MDYSCILTMWRKSPVPFLKGKRPLVMAHRGDSAAVPENSLKALQDAVDLKVDVIETDLRLTKDDDIVIFHDATVNRTTNGRGFVRNYTLKDLKKLDHGYRFKGTGIMKGTFPYRGRGFQIQSIEEVLNRFPKIKVNMDIKDRNPKAPEILARKLKELDAEDRVMVGSFHTKQLERFRLISGAPTSAGPSEVWNFRQKVYKWMRKNPYFDLEEVEYIDQELVLDEPVQYFALQIPERFSFIRTFKGPEFFNISHKLAIAIHVWTVNEPGIMFRLLDWGVDGIFSDDPKLLMEIVEFKVRKWKKT